VLHLRPMDSADGYGSGVFLGVFLLCPSGTVAARVAYADALMSRLRHRVDRLALSTRARVERAGELDAQAQALFADSARVKCEIFVATMH
jgi:hypothetical protein